MDIWIGGHSAVELLRMARSGRWPRLYESNDHIVGHSSAGVGRTWREAVCELGQYLDVSPSHPLTVRVADGAHRIRSSVVDCEVNSSVFPNGSFLIAELGASGTTVRVDAPEHQLLSLARYLSPLVSMTSHGTDWPSSTMGRSGTAGSIAWRKMLQGPNAMQPWASGRTQPLRATAELLWHTSRFLESWHRGWDMTLVNVVAG